MKRILADSRTTVVMAASSRGNLANPGDNHFMHYVAYERQAKRNNISYRIQ